MAIMFTLTVFMAMAYLSVTNGQDERSSRPYPVCKVRYGFCPPLVVPNPKEPTKCETDCHCPNDHKCCKERCGNICRPMCPAPRCLLPTKPFHDLCRKTKCNIPGAFCREHSCNGISQAWWYKVDPVTGKCYRVICGIRPHQELAVA